MKFALRVVPELVITAAIVAALSTIVAGAISCQSGPVGECGGPFWPTYLKVIPYGALLAIAVWCVIGAVYVMDNRYSWIAQLNHRKAKKLQAAQQEAAEIDALLKREHVL